MAKQTKYGPARESKTRLVTRYFVMRESIKKNKEDEIVL